MTLEEAILRGLLPVSVHQLTPANASIKRDPATGHAVIKIDVTEAMGHHTTDFTFRYADGRASTTFDLRGDNAADPGDLTDWSADNLVGEFAAGLTGATMDCYATMSPAYQASLFNDLNDILNINETNPGPAPDDDQPPDTDPNAEPLYNALKQLACDLQDWLNAPGCDMTSGSIPEMLEAAARIAEDCQHTLLDAVAAKVTRCKNTPPDECDPEIDPNCPEPAPPPEPGPPGTPPGPCVSPTDPLCLDPPSGGCGCSDWPGWVICPNCASPIYCTCQGTCHPIGPEAHNC